jgi:hypothetical protein
MDRFRKGMITTARRELASGLPFRAGSFDVVIHTDVLC